ncbi:hypothetical protein KC19_11G100700 [Ceratodon purpureus]|uniref:Protein kinase domain-containing protein n=1 Tax=Ceratodon purpureus TaxID=3225 RepID=A0A8T0GCY6_CERPU|nr:hypothetical protein KC19_11G100700 [Ceratodon purpureus]
MATVSADDTRQDADNTVSELCSNFPTAVQVSTSDGENPQLHRKTANSRRQRGRAGKNEALVSTSGPRDANSTSTCTTAWHSVVLVFSNFLFKAFQGCLSPGQAPAIPSTDASSPSASACATQYYSARIQSMIENRAKCSDDVEYEIASSKVHWSTVDRPAGRTSERRSAAQEGGGSSEDESEGEEVIDERELDEDILKANREAIKEQRQHHAWGRCFQEDRDTLFERREKIAEGGEAKIYAGIRTDLLEGEAGRHVVFKVFPRGYHLRDLVKLWPEGAFSSPFIRGTKIEHVMLLPNDGRIAMVMERAWGDLRRLIDMKKQANGNRGPPFNTEDVFDKMRWIAYEMKWLHEDDVVHRDLKASNVLLYGHGEDFPSNLERTGWSWLERISDYECALGVMGTGFWRAPEVLLGMMDPKKRCSPTLFTKKSDVYSYGMLCYEIVTGFLPFELEGFSGTRTEQDLVINGKRPSFRDDVDGSMKDLITRCWHQDEDKRPTFDEIYDETKKLAKEY